MIKLNLNGTAKWFGVVLSFTGLACAVAYKHGAAMNRIDNIEVKQVSDVADVREDIRTLTERQTVMREEQIRQGRILERVAAKVGADPN